MVFESLSFLSAIFLIFVIFRVIQLFHLTRIGDFLLFGLVNLGLIVNSIFQMLFGFSSILTSISGVIVLNLLFLLFIRVTDRATVTLQIVVMNVLNFLYISITLYESLINPNFLLLRMFIFNFMLFFIGTAGYANFVKSTIVESRYRKTGYFIWSFMTLMFAFAATLRMLSIAILAFEDSRQSLLFFEFVIGLVRFLIFLYSMFLLYFAIRNPEFLVLTYQQIIRALKAFKKVSTLGLVEEKEKTKHEDPDKLLAYLQHVSKLLPKK